jgi:broad specificity phosphatase PhoE
VAVYLVRHACAGDKREWPGRDDERPLDEVGVGQAEALAAALGAAPIRRIVSSPTQRCRQSVEPLARRLGLEVELHDSLRSEATLGELHDLLAGESTADDQRDVVLCTHGELMRPLLAEMRKAGIPIGTRHDGDDSLMAKGTAWRLTLDAAGAVTAVEHLVPSGLPHCSAHAWA